MLGEEAEHKETNGRKESNRSHFSAGGENKVSVKEPPVSASAGGAGLSVLADCFKEEKRGGTESYGVRKGDWA